MFQPFHAEITLNLPKSLASLFCKGNHLGLLGRVGCCLGRDLNGEGGYVLEFVVVAMEIILYLDI